MSEIVKRNVPVFPHNTISKNGYLLSEDFGNYPNPVLECSIEKSGGMLIEKDFGLCLKVL
ncbi:hypothetical protein [Leptospira borgpetersenii]|uniref:Uncharacterized protein n=1 Tax=Leptospira borgpetersenii serovar Hardjo-bovis str. Sponselee TaxID=1303729 RepID=M6BYE5_LEPBO|nr:hypothetical protein [Leptospira borgpetersenii]AMX57775.1 hypothetical protein LBK6_05235 [Leptospira borgpetersenii serovar Hardjo]AMX61008.1 hypothetical protein LBK9_05170 [Leptospira borgpetersenii serovar Hardjo]AMX64251.1 hypothetical protein LBK30_05200 [Leptospira borgpetersenii serovar Hardjo]AMX67492.1 hypothetical protein LBHA_05185 [Leptospira borgpetersenii serovar Hardjo]AMX71774.1 hypothetical protein LBHB_11040 [Leptospira borgpetersenii serovar Hardjo]